MGMNYSTEIIQKEREYLNETIKCCYLGIITKLDPPYAAIQPMAKTFEGEKKPEIQKALISIPPLHHKYIDTKGQTHIIDSKLNLKVGDHVVVAVSNNDTSHYSTDQDSFNVFNTNLHSVEDSIIISKVATKEDFKL